MEIPPNVSTTDINWRQPRGIELSRETSRTTALTKLSGMGHIWTIYGYDMG